MDASLENGIVELEKRLKALRGSGQGRVPTEPKPVASPPAGGPSISPM
jgi:hypothetical protein